LVAYHWAAVIRIRLSRAARDLFTTRSKVRVNVRVFLRTGSTFVRKRSITFTMRKVASSTSFSLLGGDVEKAIPQNPRARSADLMPAAAG
jgi:hypothetical protein